MKEFIICFTENKWYSLDLSNDEFNEEHNISATNKYYSFQVSDFVRHIKSKDLKTIPSIVNIESFDKQFSQSGKDLFDFKRWHILKSLRRENIINSRYRISDVKDFLLKIKDFINKLINAQDIELERFNKIEIKINRIIHETSFGGIKIDKNILDSKCVALHKEIYKLKNEFQFSYNIFLPENFETQANYLKKCNYRILQSVERTVSLLRKSDVVCEKFNNLNRLIIDLKTLMLLKSRLGGVDFVHPYFVGFGTITSRIIIKEPSLQNLRKANRNIIIPNTGRELFYIDYCQFEASILAHYSGDRILLDLINTKDIYSDIVEKIFKKEVNDENRKEAKILFYRYLYGDTFENNLKFKKQVDNYFNGFKELSKFKVNLRNKSIENGYVSTENGNFRQLDIDNDNIWILSHYIQSNASYIFKKAISETYDKIKEARLLIPLHDGALYEIDIENSEDIKNRIIKIFEIILLKECNSLKNVKALETNFYPLFNPN